MRYASVMKPATERVKGVWWVIYLALQSPATSQKSSEALQGHEIVF